MRLHIRSLPLHAALLGMTSLGVLVLSASAQSTQPADLKPIDVPPDAVPTPPAAGLQDIYLSVGTDLPAEFDAKLIYHYFLTDDGGDSLGQEVDLTIGRPLGEQASLLLKAALFDGESGIADVARLWAQLEFKM